MRRHAVLSRRGALGLAALLPFVRPPAAASRPLGRALHGEAVEIRSFGQSISLDQMRAQDIWGEMIHDVRTGKVLTPPAHAGQGRQIFSGAEFHAELARPGTGSATS